MAKLHASIAKKKKLPRQDEAGCSHLQTERQWGFDLEVLSSAWPAARPPPSAFSLSLSPPTHCQTSSNFPRNQHNQPSINKFKKKTKLPESKIPNRHLTLEAAPLTEPNEADRGEEAELEEEEAAPPVVGSVATAKTPDRGDLDLRRIDRRRSVLHCGPAVAKGERRKGSKPHWRNWGAASMEEGSRDPALSSLSVSWERRGDEIYPPTSVLRSPETREDRQLLC